MPVTRRRQANLLLDDDQIGVKPQNQILFNRENNQPIFDHSSPVQRSKPPQSSTQAMMTFRNELANNCRDRTSEFVSVVGSIHGGFGTANDALRNRPAKSHQRSLADTAQWKQFLAAAKHIGTDIGRTYTKLGTLAEMAKSRSLFDERVHVDIQELTYIIKQDIASLNKQIAQLQQRVKNDGNDDFGRHIRSQNMKTHSSSVVVSLQSSLASMSTKFKNVLETRTENLKVQQSRREKFVNGPLPNANGNNGFGKSVLLADEFKSRAESQKRQMRLDNSKGLNNGSAVIDMDGASGYTDSRDGGYDQQRMQQMMLNEEYTDEYVHNRAETMQSIEQTIVELGGIFQQLAFMVKEQEETIHRIDANVDDAMLNVEGAHTELLKYFKSVTGNRWLMIKVFGVLIVFAIIFTVFMV